MRGGTVRGAKARYRLAGVFAALVAAAPAPTAGQVPTLDADTTLQVFGEADYDWRIRPLDGPATTLAAFRREVLFINLWASWCTPCVRELGSIERLRRRLDDTDVRFLVVAAEAERPVRRFLRQYPYDLPFYLEISRMPSAFGLRGIPTSWVVDAEGRFVLLRHGEAVWDTDEVEAFLRRISRPPSPS